MFYDLFVIGKHPLRQRGLLLQLVAFIAIWSTLPAVILIHLSIWIYQHIYFTIFDIPKASIGEYIFFDRNRLRKLNIARKMGCMYCAYANGIAAWSKAVANRTEIYSCSIKHSSPGPGQEHQKDFFPYEKFLKRGK